MDDREAKATARLEHASDLARDAVEIVHVVEEHERDDEIGRRGGERQLSGVGDLRVDGRYERPSGLDERGRAVEADHGVASRREIPRDAALAAAEIDGQPPRRRHEREELVPVELVVAVVPGPPDPRDPGLCLRIPRFAQSHRFHPSSEAASRPFSCSSSTRSASASVRRHWARSSASASVSAADGGTS